VKACQECVDELPSCTGRSQGDTPEKRSRKKMVLIQMDKDPEMFGRSKVNLF